MLLDATRRFLAHVLKLGERLDRLSPVADEALAGAIKGETEALVGKGEPPPGPEIGGIRGSPILASAAN